MTRTERIKAARKHEALKARCAEEVKAVLRKALLSEGLSKMERYNLSMDVMNDLSFEFDQKIEELADTE